MKKWGWIWAMILVSVYSESQSQKKWDGEGNDSLWNNPKNWHPDGLPNSTDSVVIDNSLFQKDIFIWVLDTVPIVIHALTVLPIPPLRITLEIPAINTHIPAISLLSKSISLSIHPNGTLINQSGASSGNTILLAGKFWIGNAGKYIHRTLRGNANLISALSVDPSNYKGVFEFDVPGSSGYTISISGRQFGTLQLSATRTPKKTYNGSGSSHLVVWGDLNVGDSATFNSTLNGNIGLHGNINILGRCLLNPSTRDSVSGRQLQFWSDTSKVTIKGTLSLGDNFRNIVIEKGETKLFSSVTLPKNSQSLIIRKGAVLDLQAFQVTGPGKFKTEHNASIKLTRKVAVDSLNSHSSIFMQLLEFDPTTNAYFYGDSMQQTGIHFPPALGKLTIDKKNESVYLSKTLELTDTLLLKAGNLKSTELNQLVFKGKYIDGHDSAYIDGPLTVSLHENKHYKIPIGDSSTYAPVLMYRNSNDSSRYFAQYKSRKSSFADSSKIYPLISITDQGYWIIQQLDTSNSTVNADSLLFYISQFKTDNLKGQPAMSRFDTVQKKWIGIPSAPMELNGRFLKIAPHYVKSGHYSLGELQLDALSKNGIELIRKRKNENMILEWTVADESRFTHFILERSQDGATYFKIDSVRSTKQSKSITHSSNPLHDRAEKYYYRIKGHQTDGKFMFSNIVFVSPQLPEIKVFPNPAQKILILQGVIEKIKSIRVFHSEKTSTQTILWSQNAETINLDISQLNSGVYELVLQTEKGIFYKTRFIKIN